MQVSLLRCEESRRGVNRIEMRDQCLCRSGGSRCQVNYKKEGILRRALRRMSVWFPRKQALRERFECEKFIGEIKDMRCGGWGGETGKAAGKVVYQPVSTTVSI